jgi:enoyl-CoA hydratase/carnithine racemase
MTAAVTVDPALFIPVGDWLPAEAAVEGASIVVVPGDVPDHPAVRQFLGQAIALTIGKGSQNVGFDLWSTDQQEIDRWVAQATQHPQASLAAALLLRRPAYEIWDGLVAESSTYSVLQSGAEFQGWLGSADRPRADTDRSSRVRTEAGGPGQPVEVVLTRARRHNALDVQMREELLSVLDQLRLQPPPQIIVRGDGPSFCSGGDLGEFGTFPDPASAYEVRLRRSLALRFAALGPRLTVGLHGACLGAGIELAAFAGLVIAADDSRIGLPENALGLIPGAGGTVSIRRRIGPSRTLEMIISGKPIDAGTAHAWGLVDEVVPRSELDHRLRQLSQGLSP